MSGLIEPPTITAPGDRIAGQHPSRVTRRAIPGPSRPILVAALIGALWAIAGLAARPIDQTCDPRLTREVCLETIDAALRKGLPAVHPLLLSAHAEPGPAAEPDQLGHRATVRFGLTGIPDPVSVRLFVDAGAHWGGIADRTASELILWTAGEGIVVAGAAAGGWMLLERRRVAMQA